MTKTSKQQLFVDDGGTGELPVVFVHSLAGRSDHWIEQLSHLRRSHRALAVDLRGHGRSASPPEGDFRIETLAADLATVVDRLGERFVLVGHSLGGLVSISYADEHPQRVAGLFLLDPSSDGRMIPSEQAKTLMTALVSEAYQPTIEAYWGSMLTASSSDIRERVLRDLRATNRATIVGAFESMLTFDPVTPLQRYDGPRLSITTKANETPAALHVLIPELPHRSIEGTGHWVQLDAPDKVSALLDEFLSSISMRS